MPFAELARVCRSNGRVVLCDRVASPNPTPKWSAGWTGYKRLPGHVAAALSLEFFGSNLYQAISL
jgi:hypothetical protein